MTLSTPEIRKFRSSPVLRAALRALLNDGTMVEALKALQSTLIPRDTPPHVSGVHHDTVIAHRFHSLQFGHNLIETLQAMGTEPGKSDSDPVDLEKEAWVPAEYQKEPEKLHD